MNGRAYYNEHDPFAAQWLAELIRGGHIASGNVDARSIVDVRAADLRGYTQCHFFAGIGGWSHALRLAGWSDTRPVWTGSCPCQPFTFAARGRNVRGEDDRHFWPIWASLIAECAPRVVIGEQVAAAGDWFDRVCDDMEIMGYSIGATILPACAVGFDHARSRIFFVGDSNIDSESRLPIDAEMAGMQRHRSDTGNMAATNGISGRMELLCGYGNAIVPPLAAEFIGAYMSL